jgi:hypothetical protein
MEAFDPFPGGLSVVDHDGQCEGEWDRLFGLQGKTPQDVEKLGEPPGNAPVWGGLVLQKEVKQDVVLCPRCREDEIGSAFLQFGVYFLFGDHPQMVEVTIGKDVLWKKGLEKGAHLIEISEDGFVE